MSQLCSSGLTGWCRSGLEVLVLVARGLDAADVGCRGCVINVMVCSILGLTE